MFQQIMYRPAYILFHLFSLANRKPHQLERIKKDLLKLR